MTLSRREMIEQVVAAVASWQGVESAPHRFGGVEWRLGRVEIGHAHTFGLVDIPYTRAIRDVLIEQGRAEPHHILPETGWISFYVNEEADIERAIWLARLSYIHKGLRRLPGVDFEALIEPLDPGEELRALLARPRREAADEG